MSYTKQTWASGDTVTSAKLNHMESGIETASMPDLVFKVDSQSPNSITSATLEVGSYAAVKAKAEAGDYITVVVYYYEDTGTVIISATFNICSTDFENNYDEENEYFFVEFTNGYDNQGITLDSDGTITIGI